MRRFVIPMFTAMALSVPYLAWADEQITPLAEDGDWAAISHSNSMTDPADVCLATALAYGFALRVDNKGDIDIRFTNKSWSLPADVSGKMKVSVNGNVYSYDIQDYDATTVDASLSQDQLTALVSDLEAGSSVQVQAGSAASVTLPLDGSKSVLTAFMTCAGIQNPSSNTGGNNPFASPPSQ